MRYNESIEQSAEYLRLALPLMSRQNAAFHPISYSIWYEYVAGINPALKEAIGELTKDGRTLDEDGIRTLFSAYIAADGQDAAQRATSGIVRVMREVSHNAAAAGEHAQRFEETLAQWTEENEGAVPGDTAGSSVGTLLSSTREMQGAIATLQHRLEESRKEIEILRVEVSRAKGEALTDELTGLANRRGFELALAACLADRAGTVRGPCLLMADIDHFKRVNDTYGHLVGDRVLRAIAQILRANVKGKDTAARFGGEEFIVLLPDTDLHGAQSLAEKLRMTIEQSRIRRIDTQQEIAQITISLGVGVHCRGEDAADFIARVDAALYAAKTQGRNRTALAPARLANA